MAAVVVIPARFGSTRFPAKILASSTGRPLVQHVVDQVRLCSRVREIIVATDDARIVEGLSAFGTRCVMTSVNHQSGTDRIAEVAKDLQDDVIINVQGDEPEISPEIIDHLIERFEKSSAEMGTAVTPFPESQDIANPNLVKAIVGMDGNAIYFSRSPIPFYRDPMETRHVRPLLHLGLYAYKRSFLLEFTRWAPTPLELTEKLEQLRALEHGKKIMAMLVEHAAHGIDTQEQYQDFVNRWNKDHLPGKTLQGIAK